MRYGAVFLFLACALSGCSGVSREETIQSLIERLRKAKEESIEEQVQFRRRYSLYRTAVDTVAAVHYLATGVVAALEQEEVTDQVVERRIQDGGQSRGQKDGDFNITEECLKTVEGKKLLTDIKNIQKGIRDRLPDIEGPVIIDIEFRCRWWQFEVNPETRLRRIETQLCALVKVIVQMRIKQEGKSGIVSEEQKRMVLSKRRQISIQYSEPGN